MNYEIELKGVLDGEHLEKIEALRAVEDRTIGNTISRVLTATYFDTPDYALYRQGLSLRVRKSGKTYTQCLKQWDRSLGGMIGRKEWEVRISGPTPKIDLIENKKKRERIVRIGEENLRAVFQCVVRRHSHKLEFADGTTAVLDFDIGEVAAGAAKQLICEFELELTSGSAERLLEFASIINQEVPFRLSTVSKAARGFALLNKDTPRARKWVKSSLPKKSTTKQAFADTLQRAISHLQANEAAALLDDAEGIHQMRIALRRMSTILRAFRSILAKAEYDWAMGEAKWLRNELSSARSWDVLVDDFLPPVADPAMLVQGFDTLKSLAEDERQVHREQTHRAITSARYTEFLLRLSTWLCGDARRDKAPEQAATDATELASDLLTKQLAKRFRNVHSIARKFKSMSGEDRHKLRISIKNLRYLIDLCADNYKRKKVRAFRKMLNPVQARLGYMNDVIAVELMLQTLADESSVKASSPVAKAAGIVIGWHRREARLIEKQLASEVARLREAPAFWERK